MQRVVVCEPAPRAARILARHLGRVRPPAGCESEWRRAAGTYSFLLALLVGSYGLYPAHCRWVVGLSAALVLAWASWLAVVSVLIRYTLLCPDLPIAAVVTEGNTAWRRLPAGLGDGYLTRVGALNRAARLAALYPTSEVARAETIGHAVYLLAVADKAHKEARIWGRDQIADLPRSSKPSRADDRA